MQLKKNIFFVLVFLTRSRDIFFCLLDAYWLWCKKERVVLYRAERSLPLLGWRCSFCYVLHLLLHTSKKKLTGCWYMVAYSNFLQVACFNTACFGNRFWISGAIPPIRCMEEPASLHSVARDHVVHPCSSARKLCDELTVTTSSCRWMRFESIALAPPPPPPPPNTHTHTHTHTLQMERRKNWISMAMAMYFNNRVLRLPAIVLLNTTFRPGNSGLLRIHPSFLNRTIYTFLLLCLGVRCCYAYNMIPMASNLL